MENDLILTGQDEKLLRKHVAAGKRLQLKLNREARKQLKEQKKRKEQRKTQKPHFVQTVNHKPTYSILSYKRVPDLDEDGNEIPHTKNKDFRCTPAFVSKSEIQSMKSQSRLKNGIGWMLLFADKKHVYSKIGKLNVKTGKMQHNFYFKLAFITLTLSDSQMHSDEYIKEHMLQPFLYWLNRYYNSLYVWKAESQLNGNIHFHITIDTFVPWKAVRTKWNKILSKHGYCKVLQDGSNDKGDAATQIKAVLNEKECAKDIGGYMSKKDCPKDVLMKAFKYLVDADFEIHKETVSAYKWIKKTKELPKSAQIIFQTVKNAYDSAQLHCKWAPALGTFNDITEKWEESIIENPKDILWYKRVIDGRLWGSSENLSGVNVFIDETYHDFKKEEKIFFRQNKDIYNLGAKVIQREKDKYSKIEIAERQVRGLTDEDIEHRYRFMNNVFIHRHLSEMKKGSTLQRLIHEEKLSRQKNFQTSFKMNSLDDMEIIQTPSKN